MRVLIDIGHPAHVHLFKNFSWEMIEKGHDVFFTCRDKEFEIYLLTKYGFKYKSFGKKYVSKVGKVWGLIEFDVKEFLAGLKFRPDIFLSHGSIYAAHAAFLLRKPNIALEDTFNFEQLRLSIPFSDVILTADYDHPLTSNKKNISYAGYHELAYLHPNRFEPDKKVLNELGVNENEKYVIIRFVAWQASHDYGHQGISFENKLWAVKEFKKYARVFISSEGKLPDELKQYKIPIPAEKMHDAIAFASLVVGESFTLLSEAAVLGTPAILMHDTHCYYLQEQQRRYNLSFNYSESAEDQITAINKAIEILRIKDIKQEWHKRKESLLRDKIDVTTFLVWFVENYPESFKVMKKNPNYQLHFK